MINASSEELLERWPKLWPFLGVGSVCVVAGGLVAAVSSPLGLEQGPWAAAYLVLVGGVALIALASGQAIISESVPPSSSIVAELATWIVSGAIVMIGSLTGSAVVTTLGGVVLAGSLVLFLVGVRRPSARAPGWLVIAYRGLATFVLLSIPVGLVLSWIRHG